MADVAPIAADRQMSAGTWLMLLTLSVVWGGSFFFAKVAVAEIPPLTLVFGRVVLAAVALNLVLRLGGRHLPLSRRAWAAFLGMGLLNNVLPFSLIFWGQTQIASGLAALLNATTPLFTAVLAHLLTTDERLTPARGAGLLLGLLGVAAMVGPGIGEGGLNLLAQFAVLGGALSYACAGLFARRFVRLGISALEAAAGQLSATTLIMLPVSLAADRPWTLALPGAGSWVALAGLALLSTAFGYVLFFRILARSGATNVSLVTLLIPASAMILGAAFLGERFGWTAFAGLALLAAGLLVIDGRLLRRFA